MKKYPEMKEEKEKEKSENEKRVKELAERRAKKHALDIVIDDKPEKSQRDFQDLGKSELITSNQTSVIMESDAKAEGAAENINDDRSISKEEESDKKDSETDNI